MTPADYVNHAREVLLWSEEKIERRRYYIEIGHYYRTGKALEASEQAHSEKLNKQCKTDAERDDWKARNSHFSTRYGAAWLKKNGERIAAYEYRDRWGRLHDVMNGFDHLGYNKCSPRPRLWQHFTPGKAKEHMEKLTANGAFDKAREIGADVFFCEWIRGQESKPVKCYKVPL